MTEDLYYSKYLKYKNKYIQLKALIGGKNEDYDYSRSGYKYHKFNQEFSKQIYDLNHFYNIFFKQVKKDWSGIDRQALITDDVNIFYDSLELMDKLIDQWLESHAMKSNSDIAKWLELHNYKSPSIILENQLKGDSNIRYFTGDLEIIKKIYILMCNLSPTKEEYLEKYDDGKSFKSIRELAIKIYKKIHPELIEQAKQEDRKSDKEKLLLKTSVYRIGDGIGCQSFHTV